MRTVIITRSLHYALPILRDDRDALVLDRLQVGAGLVVDGHRDEGVDPLRHEVLVLVALLGDVVVRPLDDDLGALLGGEALHEDRKSTRLNSSHVKITYAV